MAMKVTEAINCAPGAFMPRSRPASAAGMTPVSRVQHMNSISAKLHRARRSGSAHRKTVTGRATSIRTVTTVTPPRAISADQGEVDLRAKQDENEKAHDERGGQYKFAELLRFASLHPEAERFLVAKHDAEHEHRHEAAGLQATRCEIGANDRDQRDHRRIFGEEGPALMRDQKRGQIAEHDAGDDADDGLFHEIEQRRGKRKLTASRRHRQHAEGEDRAPWRR